MFANVIAGYEGQQREETATARHALGTKMVFNDGREFRYVKAGGSALAPGKLYQRVVVHANYDELVVPTARAVGSRTVTVTTGATAVTANQLKGGFVAVEDDTGEGFLYLIDSNEAAGTTATLTIVLADPRGLKVAWTTSTTVAILENAYDSIIVHPSPPTAPVVGIACHALTASYYGWVQTKGETMALTDGTLVVGKACIPSINVDGAVGPPLLTEGTPNTGGDQLVLGQVVSVAVDTEYSVILLNLP